MVDPQARIDLDELRTLFLEAEESAATRALALGLSVALLAVVLLLVRRRRLREEFTPLWVAVALSVVVVSLNFDLLRWVARLIGAWAVSSVLFFLALVFLVVFALHTSVKLSRQNQQIKSLTQEIAMLRARLEEPRDAASSEEPGDRA